MPKKLDETLKKNGIYISQTRASKIYTGEGVDSLIRAIRDNESLSEDEKTQQIEAIKSKQKVQSIRLRVPVGWKDLIEKRVNTKGQSSINSYICDLIAKDLGIGIEND